MGSPSTRISREHADQVARGERFEFGDNWRRFLAVLDEDRITEAVESLRDWLGGSLEGRSFLDIGSGSGLFSLAAYRLGAARIHSLDFDPASVACTAELRRRYAGDGSDWTVAAGDVLDPGMMAELGQWDVVYSWGVLHHTGAMWRAIDHAQQRVAPCGTLYISIYNDQGFKSRQWIRAKRTYNRLPKRYKVPFAVLVMGPREMLSLGAYTAVGHPERYVKTWTEYKRSRGMSRWHDIIDWIGGYPFEVAKPELVFEYLTERGFELQRLFTCAGGLGCNQYVFTRRCSSS